MVARLSVAVGGVAVTHLRLECGGKFSTPVGLVGSGVSYFTEPWFFIRKYSLSIKISTLQGLFQNSNQIREGP